MKLKQAAIDRIKVNTRIKNLLALALDRSVYTVTRWIEDNDDNLTKAAALKIIREETGLSDEDILEMESEISR